MVLAARANAYLLEHGQSFEIKPKPTGAGLRMGREGFCDANSLRAAVGDETGRFIYCEGVARTRQGVCGGHAWLLDTADGCAVDITWRTAGIEYFGVPFITEAAVWATQHLDAPELPDGARGVLLALWSDPKALDDAVYSP